ncbi:MAG: EAL domain-containing protein [Phormidesmis sp. RL_2_1]|nr:EAL domain-containing protein [Phormidesmis sp. RL_2_1]
MTSMVQLSDGANEEFNTSSLALKQQLASRRRAEQALLATKRRLQRLLDSSPAVIYSSQPASGYSIIFVSDSVRQFGYQPQDFLDSLDLWQRCIHPDDSAKVLLEFAVLIRQKHWTFEYRFRHRNGEYRWIQDQRNLLFNEDGKLVEIIGSWQDITERKRIETALFHEKELAQNILQSIGDAVITTDASGCIQYMNPAAEQMTGQCLLATTEMPLSQILISDPASLKPSITHTLETAKTVRKAVGLLPDQVFIVRDGHKYTIDGSVAPICDRANRVIGTVVIFRDITQHRVLARQLSWQSSHDFLTGLANRREFEQQLAQAIATAQTAAAQTATAQTATAQTVIPPVSASATAFETNAQNVQSASQTPSKRANASFHHTLCYLDLDQFKVVNDTCGHAAGDELLRQLSSLMRQRLRAVDTLARLGGDEFGIILRNCSVAQAASITDNLLKSINGFRFAWQGNVFAVGASAGLVELNAQCGDLNSVLGAADAACFAAKHRGRNCFQVYQADDQDLAKQRGERQWVARILKALEDNRFCLYQQAIVPVNPVEGSVTHYEMLLRMIDETGEIISPMAFIPAAERYGLMPMLDRWVISHFFADYDYYAQHLLSGSPQHKSIYTLNLSGLSINDEYLATFLKEQFTRHNILPQTICFEITETAAIKNLSKAAELVEEIKELGCAFALDDFGSGMSSFTYLKTLPVDYVKIDGSFIHNIIQDSVDSAMVECVTRIGRELGIQTIAEFVENNDIFLKLKTLGVDYAQGFGVGMPSPLDGTTYHGTHFS